LRTISEERGRRVTWLELFFDLIFVAAVSQVAEPLGEHYSLEELVRLMPLLALIWWAWTGHTMFSTRFDTDDTVQRGLTLLQIFAVAVMAANAKDALDSRSSAGFAAAYAGVRLVLVFQYVRARHIAEARPLTSRYIAGHGMAAILWLASALLPTPERYAVWIVAFAVDLGTPWLAIRHSVRVPPDASHLPERFGLFTLILLGELVVAVMHGMESQEHWPPSAALAAFLGMSNAFMIWWWYFDGIAATSEQPVRSKRDAVRFHVWSYAHFPLYIGIVVTGVGMRRIVTAAARQSLTSMDGAMLAGALATVMLAMIAVGSSSAQRKPHHIGGLLSSVFIAVVTFGIGISRAVESPAILIVALTALSFLQIVVMSRLKRAGAPQPIETQGAAETLSVRIAAYRSG
jgi:low temperature requirement protein LtrA